MNKKLLPVFFVMGCFGDPVFAMQNNSKNKTEIILERLKLAKERVNKLINTSNVSLDLIRDSFDEQD